MLTEDERARFGTNEHCETRRCRQPVAITTGRWFTRKGRRMVAEHFVCLSHGQEFAARHGIEVTR